MSPDLGRAWYGAAAAGALQRSVQLHVPLAFTTCMRSLLPLPQDVLARYKTKHSDLKGLPNKAVFQMNDTHPTIAVAELMRLLLDQEGLDWATAWSITTQVQSLCICLPARMLPLCRSRSPVPITRWPDCPHADNYHMLHLHLAFHLCMLPMPAACRPSSMRQPSPACKGRKTVVRQAGMLDSADRAASVDLLGKVRADAGVHQPHRHARGPGEVARRRHAEAAAPPHGDHRQGRLHLEGFPQGAPAAARLTHLARCQALRTRYLVSARRLAIGPCSASTCAAAH